MLETGSTGLKPIINHLREITPAESWGEIKELFTGGGKCVRNRQNRSNRGFDPVSNQVKAELADAGAQNEREVTRENLSCTSRIGKMIRQAAVFTRQMLGV